jgi:PTS system ascorbate-specific IIA component
VGFKNLAEAFGENSIRVGAVALDREDAVAMAGDLLIASGRVTPEYQEQMVAVLETHGPYFVLAPGIALAHAESSDAVLATGLSLVVLSDPIVFGNQANDPVRLVVGLCAVDHDSHIEMLGELSTLLSDENAVNTMLNSPDIESIRELF